MKCVLFCGQSSYPRTDTATANRYRALAEMTAALGHPVVFVNRHPVYEANDGLSQRSPEFTVLNVSGTLRKRGWLQRQLIRITSIPREMWQIARLSRSTPISYINVYTQFSIDVIIYSFLAKILRTQCILHVVEYRSEIDGRNPLLRINDRIFEALAPRLFTRFVAITSTLRDLVLSRNPDAQVSVIPPVCNFDEIAKAETIIRAKPFFLYCASLAYEDVAWFVIQSFVRLSSRDVELLLVLSGHPSERIRDVLVKDNRVKVLSHLEYSALLGLYKGAYALLIPLRNTKQDASRYPQKITEYLASGRPIISCNVGEVGRDFTHGVNAFLAENYDVNEYAAMLELALSDPANTDQIASRGYDLGAQLFDGRSQQAKLQVLLT